MFHVFYSFDEDMTDGRSVNEASGLSIFFLPRWMLMAPCGIFATKTADFGMNPASREKTNS
jgi:hypothetical protein